jgi:multicomponent Na+:H+ antiporter subunit C
MLTAIVVGVATLGVALALAIKVYKEYGTLEESEINQRLRRG